MLNKVQIGNIDDDVEKLLKARFIHESDENYPKDALHMLSQNELAMRSNETALNYLHVLNNLNYLNYLNYVF